MTFEIVFILAHPPIKRAVCSSIAYVTSPMWNVGAYCGQRWTTDAGRRATTQAHRQVFKLTQLDVFEGTEPGRVRYIGDVVQLNIMSNQVPCIDKVHGKLEHPLFQFCVE